MQQGIEVTLIGMNEIAQEGLKRILTSENFAVRTMHLHELCDGHADDRVNDAATRDEHLQIFMIDSGLSRGGEGALDICEKVHQRYPDGRVAILADSFEYDQVVKAFACGVDGYILKAISCEPLFGLLRLIALGEKVLPSQLAENLNRHHPAAVNDDWDTSVRAVTLSSREVEVLACLSLGMANKVISRRHNITEATVKVHVKAILRKLQVANRTQAAIWAVQHGLDAEHQLNGEAVDLVEEDADDTDILPIWQVPQQAAGVIASRHRSIRIEEGSAVLSPLPPTMRNIAS